MDETTSGVFWNVQFNSTNFSNIIEGAKVKLGKAKNKYYDNLISDQ